MSILDRRSGRERRETERYSVNIDVEWEGSVGRKAGTISDISVLGCFVLSSGEVDDTENVKIFLPLTDGMKVQFLGEVINHVFEIGFAVRFIEVSPAQQDFLEKFIDSLRK
jgi:PilZ domain